jgi:N-acetylglutamate synthase-like GNAT family acetyltransferase
MSWWGDHEVSERRRELLREAGERHLARLAREGDGSAGVGRGIGVRWGREADEEEVADLLQLNGMPRWISFEERFVVAERDGKIVAALRYRMEPKKLVLGLLVVDPWAGERDLATALYARAGELAREIGARDVTAQDGAPDYLAEAGYRRRGRGWHLEATRPVARREQLPASGWQRIVALLSIVAVPFFSPFEW